MKSACVLSDITLNDCVRKTKSALHQLKNTNTVNESVSVSCQTDIDQIEMEELVKNEARLKIEDKVIRKSTTRQP